MLNITLTTILIVSSQILEQIATPLVNVMVINFLFVSFGTTPIHRKKITKGVNGLNGGGVEKNFKKKKMFNVKDVYNSNFSIQKMLLFDINIHPKIFLKNKEEKSIKKTSKINEEVKFCVTQQLSEIKASDLLNTETYLKLIKLKSKKVSLTNKNEEE